MVYNVPIASNGQTSNPEKVNLIPLRIFSNIANVTQHSQLLVQYKEAFPDLIPIDANNVGDSLLVMENILVMKITFKSKSKIIFTLHNIRLASRMHLSRLTMAPDEAKISRLKLANFRKLTISIAMKVLRSNKVLPTFHFN